MDDREYSAASYDGATGSVEGATELEGHGVDSFSTSPMQLADIDALDETVLAPEQAIQAAQALARDTFHGVGLKAAVNTRVIMRDSGFAEPQEKHDAGILHGLDELADQSTSEYDADYTEECDATLLVSDEYFSADDEFDETVVCSIEEQQQYVELYDDTFVEESPEAEIPLSSLLVDAARVNVGFLQEFDHVAPPPPPVCQQSTGIVRVGASSPLPNSELWHEQPIRKRKTGRIALFVLALLLAAGAYFVEPVRPWLSSTFKQFSGMGLALLEPKLSDDLIPSSAPQSVEVRYCLSQGIRLGVAAEKAVGLSHVGVTQLQAMFDAYDQRCALGEFEPALYLVASREVELNRPQLEQEGVALLAGLDTVDDAPVSAAEPVVSDPVVASPVLELELVEPRAIEKFGNEQPDPVAINTTALDANESVLVEASLQPEQPAPEQPAPEQPAPVQTVQEAVVELVPLEAEPEPAVSIEPDVGKSTAVFNTAFSKTEGPRRIVKDMQWRLFKLGFYSGQIDGVFAANTQEALGLFFQSDKSPVSADEVADFSENKIFRIVDRAYSGG